MEALEGRQIEVFIAAGAAVSTPTYGPAWAAIWYPGQR